MQSTKKTGKLARMVRKIKPFKKKGTKSSNSETDSRFSILMLLTTMFTYFKKRSSNNKIAPSEATREASTYSDKSIEVKWLFNNGISYSPVSDVGSYFTCTTQGSSIFDNTSNVIYVKEAPGSEVRIFFQTQIFFFLRIT